MNEFAVTSSGLGEGLSKSASAMATAGADINKTLALLTGGAEITQDAGEFGNMLKVGSMRIRGMKGDLEALGEEWENVESVSKIQTQILNLTKGQVNIMDDADPSKFKDYYDILEGISEVYGTLKETEQADLLETLFGKQRGNQGAAIIQAFQSGQVQKAYEASLNAEGSAMQEQEKWLSSLEAKIGQFKAAMESLSSTMIDSDFLKGLVDTGTALVNVLDTLINQFGLLPTILGGVGIGALIKNFD